jgi:amino-acid N-acetyltransferase
MSTIQHKLIPATGELREKVIALVSENNLPVTDLDQQKHLYALIQGNELAGTAGLELFSDCALVRSVSLRKDMRGKGLGKIISCALEEIAKQHGINTLYLLTTTAKDFFKNEGYREQLRGEAPESIKSTTEFSTTCSSDATLMRKDLS